MLIKYQSRGKMGILSGSEKLHKAAEGKKIKTILNLLKSRVKVDVKNEEGETALHLLRRS